MAILEIDSNSAYVITCVLYQPIIRCKISRLEHQLHLTFGDCKTKWKLAFNGDLIAFLPLPNPSKFPHFQSSEDQSFCGQLSEPPPPPQLFLFCNFRPNCIPGGFLETTHDGSGNKFFLNRRVCFKYVYQSKKLGVTIYPSEKKLIFLKKKFSSPKTNWNHF